jgi:hypothetical protein
MAREPQSVQRRESWKFVAVSRDYLEKTKPTLKSFLLQGGYAGTARPTSTRPCVTFAPAARTCSPGEAQSRMIEARAF